MRYRKKPVEVEAVSDFEGMTMQRLCEWANGLGLCEFEVVERFDEEVVKVKGAKKVSLELYIGRYSESVPEHGGMAHGSIHWRDDREGFSGGVTGDATLQGLGRLVAAYADKLGMATGQLALF